MIFETLHVLQRLAITAANHLVFDIDDVWGDGVATFAIGDPDTKDGVEVRVFALPQPGSL